MNKLVLILWIFAPFCYGQDLNYLERFRLVEQYGNDNRINLGQLSGQELADIMRFAGGLDATASQASFINNSIQNLDSIIMQKQAAGIAVTPADLGSLGITTQQAQILANLVNSNSSDPSPQIFLAAIRAESEEIGLVRSQYQEDLLKEATRPSLPNSPTTQSLRRILKRTKNIQKIRMPKSSGDYLSNLSTSFDYSYTEFTDDTVGTFGQFHDWSVSLNGTVTENTDLSFGFIASESEASGSIGSEYRGETYGGDVMLIHKLNDNYGLGIYTFYQHSDFESFDTRDYGAGAGVLFSSWHDLEWLEVSTVTSLTKTYYEAGNDTLFNTSVDFTKYWNDKFSTTLRTMFTDSTDQDTPGDNTYWTVDGSLGYMLSEKLYMTVGYSTDKALKDYKSETWNIGFTLNF